MTDRIKSRPTVLVIGDSTVARLVVRHAMGRIPTIEVLNAFPACADPAPDLRRWVPDAVVLMLATLDGLKAVACARAILPTAKIVLVAPRVIDGTVVPERARQSGADVFVERPSSALDMASIIDKLEKDIGPHMGRIRRRSRRAEVGHRLASNGAQQRPAKVVPLEPKSIPVHRSERDLVAPTVLAMGSSTGGPAALLEILGQLSSDFPLPIVIVQHMPPVFTGLLAKRLLAETAFTVREAVEGAELKPREAWVAPGNSHMTVRRGPDSRVRLVLHQGEHENSCRPAVDVLFRSVALAYGAAALGVVLTGMGRDGLAGSRAIRAEGGRILAQDEESSVVWGMPGLVVSNGLANRVESLEAMAKAIEAETQSRLATASKRAVGEDGWGRR